MNILLSPFTASISELKKNPSRLLVASGGEPIAILNHNKPAAYLISASVYEEMMDRLEDMDLVKLVKERQAEKSASIEVSLDDL
jgi:antitoxin StbD